jgi:predicted Zn-dependent protease
VALVRAGRAPEAIAEFEAVLGLEPGSAQAHYNLAVVLLKVGGRKSDALFQLDAALRISPNPELRRLAARLRSELP